MKNKALFASLTIFTFILAADLAFTYWTSPTVPGSCAQPSVRNGRSCQEMAQQVLNSTVRIVLQSWTVKPDEKGYEINDSVSHATVVDGRFLITHNHFTPPLNLHAPAEEADAYVLVYLFNSSSELLFKGPLTTFELVWEDAETLVFAHPDAGFFEALGLASAEFQTWDSLALEAGMTVAQVDWNGQDTRVDWVTVQEIIIEEGTPRLVLADSAMPGASGGGIFWNGVHVANNWRVEEQLGTAGEIVGAVTTVALNTTKILKRAS